MVTEKVQDISKTKIFATSLGDKQQLTIYSNKVKLLGDKEETTEENWFLSDGSMSTFTSPNVSKSQFSYSPYSPQIDIPFSNVTPVAMVLPVPLPVIRGYQTTADEIRMIDLKSLSNVLFDELDACFPNMTDSFGARGLSTLSYSQNSAPPLKVHRCGSYRYSVVPDVNSFDRLERSVFDISYKKVLPILQKHYKKQFAFLVCIIDKSAAYSPIAYVHPCNDRFLFVPTRHYHGEDTGETYIEDDWDHAIYTVDNGTGAIFSDKRRLDVSPDSSSRRPILDKFPHYKYINWQSLKKRKIEGRHPNADIVLKI